MQISESHCGPAVIQMLLSNLGIEVTQEEVAEAGGATSLIAMNGMRVDQLAMAVHRLAPKVILYAKEHATIDELVQIVNDYHYPVGVEWQGVFEDDEEVENKDNTNDSLLEDAETEEDDFGHYSLVVRADRRKRHLIIADPYKDYFQQARIFSFSEFDERWYDFNEVTDPQTGRSALVKDDHMLFLVARPNVLFPRRMGMRPYPWSNNFSLLLS